MAMRCPECHETAIKLPRPLPRAGWSLTVDAERLTHGHADGEPLCPVVTARGYQPALPETRPPKATRWG